MAVSRNSGPDTLHKCTHLLAYLLTCLCDDCGHSRLRQRSSCYDRRPRVLCSVWLDRSAAVRHRRLQCRGPCSLRPSQTQNQNLRTASTSPGPLTPVSQIHVVLSRQVMAFLVRAHLNTGADWLFKPALANQTDRSHEQWCN